MKRTAVPKLKLGQTRLKSAEGWQQSLLAGAKAAKPEAKSVATARSMVALTLMVAVVMLALGGQLVRLQVVQGARYAALAEGNRLRQKITYAPRGNIVDRHGKVLASNRASFQLVAYPYLLPRAENERQQQYQTIAGLLKLSLAEIQARSERGGLDSHQPNLVADDIDYQPALIIEQKLPALPGWSLDGIPVREYKSDAGLAHILGYVGRASEADLKAYPYLSLVDFIGRDGAEAQYDQQLRGHNGVAKTEVDAAGRPLRVISEEPTQSGQDLQLTIDYGLQQQLAAALTEQMQAAKKVKRAAGVALNPQTGEILASVSLPSYDNNLFSGGIRERDYQQLINNDLQPLHNKVIGGAYPSGSVIKPLHLAGALQDGVVNERTVIVDRGQIVAPSVFDPSVQYIFKGWDPAGLGPMDARRAIAMSSDIYFYTVGGGFEGFKGLGVDRLTNYYHQFGLGESTGVDLPGETAGRVPTPEWKQQIKGEDWFVGDTYNISIGQGDILTSPLQMAVATAAVVNGGKLVVPHFNKTTATETKRQNFIDPKHLQVVREGMRQVIGGTTPASTFAAVPVPVAGKSGTAETDPNTNRSPHAWYTAFAPYDSPEVVFAVILEEGEGGSQFAAPAIAKAMQWYFSHPR